MTNKSKKRPTSNEKHLTDEEIAFCAQELILERSADSVPDHIQSHLSSCHTCFTLVQDFYRLICDEPGLIKAIRSEKHANTIVSEATAKNGKGSIVLQNNLYRWFAAAAVVLILVTAAFLVFTRSDADPHELFAQYHKPYHDVVTTKSLHDDHYLLNGLFYYNTGEYKQAITHFNNGLHHNPNNHDLLFYLAGSYLATGDYEKATVVYELLNTTSLEYQLPVRWYLALSYLAGNKNAEAIEMLECIRDEGGFYAQDAGEILRKLK